MSSLLGILNIGRLGINANQSAMAVTGNNISNVNTAGYSRQRADIQSLFTGGVTAAGVQRMHDDFLGPRLNDANSRAGSSSVLASNLSTIESLMSETDNSGTSKTIQDFFSALSNLSANPSGTTERSLLRTQGQQLGSALGGLANQLGQVRSQLDQQVVSAAGQINSITSEIAKLNQQIASQAGGPQQIAYSQMLDQRDQLISQLSTFMPINVVKDSLGSVTVFGAGAALVEGVNQRTLVAQPDPTNSGLSTLIVRDANGATKPAGKIDSGSLGAMLQSRDAQAGHALDQVNQLAAQLIRAVNIQHRAGTGLDGISGRDFFQGLAASAAASGQNQGGAAVTSATIANDTQLNFDDYEIRFTAPGQYDVVDATTGAALSSGNAYTSGGTISFAGMSVVLTDGAAGGPATGDVFKVNGYDGTAGRMDLSAAVKASTDAIAAGATGAPGDNTNANALAALLNQPLMGGSPALSFVDFYQQSRMAISSASAAATAASTDDQISQQQVQGLIDSTSGVSTDEEATNIIQFQRGFEASSRVISATDNLMQSLLNMVQ